MHPLERIVEVLEFTKGFNGFKYITKNNGRIKVKVENLKIVVAMCI